MNRRSFLHTTAAGFATPCVVTSRANSSETGEILRVAACQILTFPEPKRSAEKICSWLESASQEHVDVVAFPEAAICGYTCDPQYWKEANPRDFEAAENLVLAAARKLNLAVVLGTAHWEDGKLFDSLLIADRNGEVRGRYSKTHLAEKWPVPGRRLPVWTVAGVRSCFIVCHDIRYPELVRLPAIAGAQICYLCSNESGLMEEHKFSAYRAMPISRATENSIYLVMTNAPADPNNLRSPSQSHGNSKIINPDGNVLCEAGYFKETLVCAAVNLKKADRAIAKRAVNDKTILSSWLREGAELVEGRRSRCPARHLPQLRVIRTAGLEWGALRRCCC